MTDVFIAKGRISQLPKTGTSQDTLTQVLVDDPVALVDDTSASVGTPTTIESDIRASIKIDKGNGK